MEFPRQEYWNGLPLPSPGNLPDPGTESRSLALQVDSLPTEPPGKHKHKKTLKVKSRRQMSRDLGTQGLVQ